MLGEKIIPERELESLADLLSYFVTQRELAKPVKSLRRIVHDIEIVIRKIIIEYYLPLNRENEELFLLEIADYLDDVRRDIAGEEIDEIYCNYCIDRILAAFEGAWKVKRRFKSRIKRMEILMTAPILEPFDLNLRPMIRLVKASQPDLRIR